MFTPNPISSQDDTTRFGYEEASKLELLTRRQFQILRGIAQGKSNKTIAQELGIKTNTVGNHLLTIYRDLEISEDQNQRVVAALMFHKVLR